MDKDNEIKKYFSEDQIVSDKANKVFDNFIKSIQNEKSFSENKENIDIKNENINNSNLDNDTNKVVDFSERKSRFSGFRRFLAFAASFVIVFVGSNAYAHTRGYDNIFFLLKDLTTSKSTDNPDEIFSDKDIIISYSYFQVTSDVEMQINELQVKDNKAKLYLLVKELKENEETPFSYKVYNQNDEIMYDAKSKNGENKLIYTEILELSNYKDNTENLKLEIYNKDNKLVKTVTINLTEKTIEAKTENVAVQKVSQIELNKFLKNETEKIYTKKELEDKNLIILETYDIYYSNGKYIVKYLFMIPDNKDFENNTVEDSDIYLNTVEFNIEKEEYKLVDIEIPEKI